ncbi:MAG: GNAT family N-acetyltransferase [Planctomycetota bacterium]|jgi:putative acetyltransferase
MPVLRPARDSDSEGVIALIARIFAEYEGCVLDVDREEPELRAPASRFDRFWVVEQDGEILGCSACALRLPLVEMKKIYLDARLRGQGWGRRLIEEVEQLARDLGATRLEAWSDTRFTQAHGVYQHLGYARGEQTRLLHDLSNTEEFHFTKEFDV